MNRSASRALSIGTYVLSSPHRSYRNDLLRGTRRKEKSSSAASTKLATTYTTSP
ncbi:hypothetical protein IG193_07310 [Infirmifilum lucidum]|uniref:Uncharacterized protein n=1 Tax=Infirmifilum lucidum TaxID=2776706 RepID=A0A7L9FI08_9CREN|nr:hypothetical protein [Infirmifilum lucidum]QOJ78556.1 hypothetical protein IG193_07310 [Infirmifilum lucidum]